MKRLRYLIVVVLITLLARPSYAEFVYGGTTLPTKSDLLPLPAGASASNYWLASDVSSYRGASYDLRTAILSGTLHGFTAQGSQPVVAGATAFLWVDSGTNSMNFYNGTTNVVLTSSTGFTPTSRTLTGANGIAAIGDLTANRTIQLDPLSFVVSTGPTKLTLANSGTQRGSLALDNTGNTFLQPGANLNVAVRSASASPTYSVTLNESSTMTIAGGSDSIIVQPGSKGGTGITYAVTYPDQHSFQGFTFLQPNASDLLAVQVSHGAAQHGIQIFAPTNAAADSVYLSNASQAATNGDNFPPQGVVWHTSQKIAGVVYDSYSRIVGNQNGTQAQTLLQHNNSNGSYNTVASYGYTLGGSPAFTSFFQIGAASIGLYGVTPVARPSAWTINGGAQAAGNTIGAAAAGTDTANGHGFASTGEFNAFVAAVQSLQGNMRQLQREMALLGASQ